MNWRPKDWESPYKNEPPVIMGGTPEARAIHYLFNVYEAGSDAMLEALKKQGIHRDNEPFDAPPTTGTWAFIPDETK